MSRLRARWPLTGVRGKKGRMIPPERAMKNSSESGRILRHIADKHGVRADLRELVGDEVRKELRHHREEMLEALRPQGPPPPKNEPDPDELLTAEQVAGLLKVKPDTVRSWIQSGSLMASRPGNGTRPGRKYRVRRADLDTFVEKSQTVPAPQKVVSAAEAERSSVGEVECS
jgi:excisionase family DNA binding protein